MVALRVPAPVGVNVTTNVVLPPAATEDAGAVVTANSEALVPVKGMPVILSEELPVF